MERSHLLAVLRQVEPALGNKDIIPAQMCLCFDGKAVHAFDGAVTLLTPCSAGITGGLRGRVLLDFLNASRAKEVEVAQQKQEVEIKAGRAKLAVSTLVGIDDFLFTAPDVAKAVKLPAGPPLLTALAKAAVSMGNDPAHSWRVGVTVAAHPKGLVLYSSDNKTASRVLLTGYNAPAGFVAVLPPRFCELLVTIGKGDAPKGLYLAGDTVLVKFGSGLKLYTQTLQGEDKALYEKMFAGIGSDGITAAIPPGLSRAIERALVVARLSREPYTLLRVKDGKLRLKTVSEHGNVDDSIACEHAACKGTVPPELLLRALPFADRFGILPDKGCVAFKGKGFTHAVTLVAMGGDAGAEE